MQFLKKTFLGILIATALFTAAYFFIRYYNPAENILPNFTTYKSYLIFLYISIILIYLISLSPRKIAKTGIFIIILANFIRLMSLFTQTSLGISTKEFYALIVLLALGFLTTYIRFWIRYLLIVIISIPFIIIIANHFLPLYNSPPDFKGFYQSELSAILITSTDAEDILSKAASTLTLQTPSKNQTRSITTKTINESLGELPRNINFSSKTGLAHTHAYIIFPKGQILTLYPQSASSIKKISGSSTYEINLIEGKANLYNPFPEELLLTGNTKGITSEQTEMISKIIQEQLGRRNNYFIQQAGGTFILNPTIDGFIGGYLALVNSTYTLLGKIANKIPNATQLFDSGFSSAYLDNVLNYQTFHTYLPYKTRAQYIATGNQTQGMIEEGTKGYETTKTQGRIQDAKTLLSQ